MTIREQLEKLPEPYNRLALMRGDQYPLHSLDKGPIETLRMAIASGIDWEAAPEGDVWWSDVTMGVYDVKRLPPIPAQSLVDLAEWENGGMTKPEPTADQMLDWLDAHRTVLITRDTPHEQETFVQWRGKSRLSTNDSLRESIKDLMWREKEDTL